MLCVRKTGTYHVYGIRVQCGRRCRVQNNRLGTRKTACGHNKQSCAVQRTVSDADFDNHNVFYRNADENAHVAYVRTVFDGADTRRNRFYILSTFILSKTVLKGVPSSFTLELPPYRKPQIGKVIVRSVFDRTLFVLGRAAAVAAPAGIIIYLAAKYHRRRCKYS